MSQELLSRRHGTYRRLSALAAIAALSLGSLALAGCGNDDEMPPMEEPAEEAPMGDDPGMSDDPGMGQDPAMDDDGMGDPMESQEPMADEMDEENAGGF